MQIIQFLLSLSILVFIHEVGHFLFAKIFKTKVEKFYLFFNPWFSLFKYKYKDTEYGIGWLPLGGYVKIAGMSEEADQNTPPQPWEFRAKKPYQKLLIVLGGIIFNLFLAIGIYSLLSYYKGKVVLPISEVNKNGIMTDSIGLNIGIKNGDKIVLVNNKEIYEYSQFLKEVLLNKPHSITVKRNNIDTTIYLKDEDIAQIIKNKSNLIYPRIKTYVFEVAPNSIADSLKIQQNDFIIQVGEFKITYLDELRDALLKYKNSYTDIYILRNNDTIKHRVRIPENAKLGVVIDNEITNTYKLDTINFSFIKSISEGVSTAKDQFISYGKQFKLIFNTKTKAYESVGSVISIGKLFPKKWDWEFFWKITAFLSVILAFINLLPIPALDGGYALLAIYEMVFRKSPPEKFLKVAQTIGIAILIMLMIYALGNDIYQNFIK